MISSKTPSDQGAPFHGAGEPQVSILIPSTNQANLLARCLASLTRHLGADISHEIIVVLNAATDEVKAVAKNAHGVLIAESPANLGVAGGYNRARSLAGGKYLLLLHDDTEIEPHWLESLVETAEAHPEAGAIGSLVLFPEGALQGAGGVLWSDATTSPPWGSADPNPELYCQSRPVDYAGTCSLLVRAETWDAVGGLDENIYPAYYVDVDLGMSVRKHGQIVLFEPRSRLCHHRGSSSNRIYRHFMAKRNRDYFSTKWSRELQSYESHTANWEVSLQRAQRHTEHLAEELKRQYTPTSRQVSKPVFDLRVQDEVHLRMERELHNAYITHLESQWSDFELQCASLTKASAGTKEKLAHKKEKVVALKNQCADLKSQLQIIKRSRWWRWGEKLRQLFGR